MELYIRNLTRLVFILVTLFFSFSRPQNTHAASFTATGEMWVARYDHTATSLANGKVLVAGGDTNLSSPFVAPTSSAELYDPMSGHWTMTGAMKVERENHTATLLRNGKVIVAGGSGDTAPTLLSSAELYDPATGTWRDTGIMNAGRTLHTATLLRDGRILVVGGYGVVSDFLGSLSSAEIYDSVTGVWTTTGTLNAARRHHTATLLPNGKVLIAGGYGSGNETISTAELYDPESGTWTPTGPLPTEPVVGSATLLPNGKVFVAKGFKQRGGGGGYDPVGQLYDPDSGTWTATSPLSNGGTYHSEALLPDGKVLIAGGYGNIPGDLYHFNADLYDPATDTWEITDSLTTARKNHTATRLSSGKVLITGGYQGNQNILSSAELYNPDNNFVVPVILTNSTKSPSGSFQFTFTNNPGAIFQVLASTNATAPVNSWTVLGRVPEMPPGQFYFTDASATNISLRFYRVTPAP